MCILEISKTYFKGCEETVLMETKLKDCGKIKGLGHTSIEVNHPLVEKHGNCARSNCSLSPISPSNVSITSRPEPNQTLIFPSHSAQKTDRDTFTIDCDFPMEHRQSSLFNSRCICQMEHLGILSNYSRSSSEITTISRSSSKLSLSVRCTRTVPSTSDSMWTIIINLGLRPRYSCNSR
jgi:hypothetical protein